MLSLLGLVGGRTCEAPTSGSAGPNPQVLALLSAIKNLPPNVPWSDPAFQAAFNSGRELATSSPESLVEMLKNAGNPGVREIAVLSLRFSQSPDAVPNVVVACAEALFDASDVVSQRALGSLRYLLLSHGETIRREVSLSEPWKVAVAEARAFLGAFSNDSTSGNGGRLKVRRRVLEKPPEHKSRALLSPEQQADSLLTMLPVIPGSHQTPRFTALCQRAKQGLLPDSDTHG